MWGVSLSETNRPWTSSQAAVFGCSGHTVTQDERSFFEDANPLGFILFARNIDTPDQVRNLTSELRDCVGWNAPVLIDQEGGRVQRLRPPHWRSAPPMRQFGLLFDKDPDRARAAVRLNMQTIGAELADLGIDIDCAPVLDVPIPGAHDVIGDRALSLDSTVVGELAEAACEGLIDVGIVPVIKHLPGHGRAGVDSHAELPIVDASVADLSEQDFAPFTKINGLPVAGMTAHVVYEAIDDQHPATLSPRIIEEVIRNQIGFTGLLFSDDLGMKALSGSFAEKAKQSLAAGCDIALHCSGALDEMIQVASGATTLSETAAASFNKLESYRGNPRVEIDRTAAAFEVATLLEAAA